jgi:hypothetical protein
VRRELVAAALEARRQSAADTAATRSIEPPIVLATMTKARIALRSIVTTMPMRLRLLRPLKFTIAALALTAVFAATATADGNGEQIRYTAAGQSAARTALLARSDLSPSIAWTRQAYKPDVAASQIGCANFHPKVSDLVLVGAAGAYYSSKTSPSVNFSGLVEVLETAHMVQLDWQRTNASPHVGECLGKQAAAAFASSSTFVSIRPLAFPSTGTHIAAWRCEFAAKTGTKGHFVYDVVLTTRGRTEITLTGAAVIGVADSLKATEGRLAAKLVARARV